MYTSDYNEMEHNSFNYNILDYNTLDYVNLLEEVPECVIKNPDDPTKCWIDDNQWSNN